MLFLLLCIFTCVLLTSFSFLVFPPPLLSSSLLVTREILQKAENSRTGHPITKTQITIIENSELKHEEDLEKIRLRNISLKALQKKLEKTLRQREQLAEGLHMIDFEQLKIENQTLNEKIEERNEELSKLKRKKTLTVQILTHIREKLGFIEKQNKQLQAKVNTLEMFLTQKRNSVTISKLERDTLRNENKEYKAKQGFTSSDLLLMDYEKRKLLTTEIHGSIVELKNRYELLNKQMQFSTTSNIFQSSNNISSSSQGRIQPGTTPGLFPNMGKSNTGGGGGVGEDDLMISRGNSKSAGLADAAMKLSSTGGGGGYKLSH
jgi:DNA repair exonuclease SbcCD ATPase subunit